MTARRYFIIGIAIVLSVGLGAAAGYQYHDKKHHERFILASAAGETISDAKSRYTIIRLLDKGETEKAKELMRFRFHTDLFLMADWTGALEDPKARTEADEVLEKVAQHYREYPHDFDTSAISERLQEILAQY